MAIKGKLQNIKNLGVADEEKLILFIPVPGYASLNLWEAPAKFEDRLDLVEELIKFWNDNH